MYVALKFSGFSVGIEIVSQEWLRNIFFHIEIHILKELITS